MKEDIKVIKQYIKTFNDRRLREEYNLYTSIQKPTILENYFKDFIKQEINTRGIGVWAKKLIGIIYHYLFGVLFITKKMIMAIQSFMTL